MNTHTHVPVSVLQTVNCYLMSRIIKCMTHHNWCDIAVWFSAVCAFVHFVMLCWPLHTHTHTSSHCHRHCRRVLIISYFNLNGHICHFARTHTQIYNWNFLNFISSFMLVSIKRTTFQSIKLKWTQWWWWWCWCWRCQWRQRRLQWG